MATITGTFNSLVGGTLSGVIGTPGPTGATGPTGAPGPGVPSGGTTGQVLKKLSATSYDTAWGADLNAPAWGTITGTLSTQTDLQAALDAKLGVTTAASTYQTLAGMSSYSTTAQAAALFYPLSGNPSAFLTDAPSDGSTYGRNNGAWAVAGGGAFIESVTSPLLVTGTDLSIDLTGYAVESWVTAGFYPLEGNPASFATESFVTSQGYITQATADGLYYGISNPSGFITSGSLLPYATLAGATFTGLLTVKASGGGGAGLLIPLGSNPTSPIDGEIWNIGSGGLKVCLASVTETLANQSWVTSQGYITSSALTPYALLAGATFTGKVNMAAPTAGSASLNLGVGTAPTTSVAGDIWIATNINFKDSSGTQKSVANTNTSNTYTAPQIIQTTVGTVNAALRVTQLGTGNAIQVEDSTTPDATPFVVDQFGKVGIGVAPDATAAIKIDGSGMSFNGLVFNPTATAAHTGGSDTLDLLVTINGTNYRIGLRPA